MTIQIKDGNLLHALEPIIAHQVNGLGVMGAGVAKQIKKAYPAVFKTYKQFVYNTQPSPEASLGINLMIDANGRIITANDDVIQPEKIISNLFGQARIGTSQKQTNEHALSLALTNLAAFARRHHLDVAMPYKLGSGLAGGNWDDIYALIDTAFQHQTVTLYRYMPSRR